MMMMLMMADNFTPHKHRVLKKRFFLTSFDDKSFVKSLSLRLIIGNSINSEIP